MKNAEWKTAVRVLQSKGKYVSRDGKIEISKMQAPYGFDYHVHSSGYGCITVDWNLSRIKEILVD